MRRNWLYLLSLLPACVCITGNILGGWWAAGNLVFSLVILAGIETITGVNTSNAHSSPNDPIPESIPYLHVLTHTMVIVTLFFGIYSGLLEGGYIFLAAISSGVEAGSGAIIVAHELIHKANPIKKNLGKYLLLSSGNSYFFVHHLHIHHRYVGTQQDDATAFFNESVYSFFLRTIPAQFKSAWNSETQRLSKQGAGAWSFQNEMVRNLLWIAALIAGVALIAGLAGLVAFLIYTIVANLLLEYVNYIEHYGLVRKDGERVDPRHSWNCDKVISRFFLIELSRHADHHTYANKPYHMLESIENSPSLPGGYASLIVPALIPAWWKAIVHPRLEKFAEMNRAD